MAIEMRFESMRLIKLLGMIFFCLSVLAAIVFYIHRTGYRIFYQPTPSMKQGWYFVTPPKHFMRGAIVVFTPPTKTLHFLYQHHWVPNSGLLMKRIVAAPGDRVCVKQGRVWINHRKFASVYRYYAPHRALPQNDFCGILPTNYYFLMSTRVRRSFDSRYFGPISAKAIVGNAYSF
ncbi:MAG: signal peptidase I [Pseudomonadota bacterium]|nr:signal peptidase I [Gammaproteobacteria bacterium]MBU2545745.1 signal peptidase I [Gammaproteobacteria bacterium]